MYSSWNPEPNTSVVLTGERKYKFLLTRQLHSCLSGSLRKSPTSLECLRQSQNDDPKKRSFVYGIKINIPGT